MLKGLEGNNLINDKEDFQCKQAIDYSAEQYHPLFPITFWGDLVDLKLVG